MTERTDLGHRIWQEIRRNVDPAGALVFAILMIGLLLARCFG